MTMYSSLEWMLKAMSFVLGAKRRSRRASSPPSMNGMFTSRMITSGASAATLRRHSLAPAASPTTVIELFRRKARTPSRTIG
ncbi:MAG: hypothetical protein M0D55_02650 [Elusimicrobiota bacterium]|nr:MAG: hypothetical protein M0D55_02650 [Elusimicrobiota bacterium]